MKRLLLSLLLLFNLHPTGWLVSAQSSGLTLARLETDAAPEPLGIDDRAPRLSWALVGARRGLLQTAYRVLVASQPELAREGGADVWDSGRVASSDPWVVYSGPALKSRTRYYWTARAWATDGTASVWARPEWFETALLDANEWRGRWIAGPERKVVPLTEAEGLADDDSIRAAGELCRPVGWLKGTWSASRVKNNQGECREIRPAPLLRKTFQISKPVARARVYSSGLAYNQLSVNGRAASDRLLDPGFTDYSRTVLYTTQDVTALLRQGENVLASELGSGHYDDATRTWDWGWEQAEWRARPRLRLDLYITYRDGTEQLVSSDETWKVSTAGPTRYDSYYLGETYDARREINGWNRPGFDDAAWEAARVVEAPAGVLRAETHEPIRVVDVRPPGTRTEPAPGVFVYDTGQNLTGWAEVKVNAPAGTAVEIFYSEKLGQDGRASTDGNFLVFGQLQTDYYVARGKGEEVWTPRFSYKGFQYVQISGPAGGPLPSDARVTVERVQQVRTSLARTSQFESSNGTLNRIHGNTAWAVQNNMHGIITDTPVYEKNAWTGDASLTAGTASLLFDTERLYRKMFQDMLDAQTEQGEVSLLAPSNENYGYVGATFKQADCCGATPAWDAFWFVIPWESWMRYGDRRALEVTYPAMRKYLDEWVPRWTDKDGDGFAYTLTSGLGDWVPPKGVPTINALTSTAYYAHLARIAADAARALGKNEDAGRYDDLFKKIRADFNARFLGPEGFYREKDADPFVQSAQIFPLAFGLVPEEKRGAVANRLAEDILKNRGGHAYVGVLGARYVLPVLTETGHLDVALTVATQTTEPSWGFWTDALKLTSLGEQWPADTRSRNHHFFGAVVQWFYEDLAGFRPLEPGFQRIEFKPEIPTAGLDDVSASYESVRGRVAVRWRRTTTGLELDVTVPPNATGRVYVPAPSPQAVTETGKGKAVPAEKADSVKLFGVEGGRVVYEVGSGSYQFRVAVQGARGGR
ncbi:MAG: family 78 glycoside hydrolase catalytic domain [Acidobacteria bacterium]|nr:family 78 glycoside hydrolase catalytic domain [Acidobacteriota bacterium]